MAGSYGWFLWLACNAGSYGWFLWLVPMACLHSLLAMLACIACLQCLLALLACNACLRCLLALLALLHCFGSTRRFHFTKISSSFQHVSRFQSPGALPTPSLPVLDRYMRPLPHPFLRPELLLVGIAKGKGEGGPWATTRTAPGSLEQTRYRVTLHEPAGPEASATSGYIMDWGETSLVCLYPLSLWPKKPPSKYSLNMFGECWWI